MCSLSASGAIASSSGAPMIAPYSDSSSLLRACGRSSRKPGLLIAACMISRLKRCDGRTLSRERTSGSSQPNAARAKSRTASGKVSHS